VSILSLGEVNLSERMSSVSTDIVAERMDLYDHTYDVAHELRRDGSARGALETQARTELAVSEMLAEGNHGGFTTPGDSGTDSGAGARSVSSTQVAGLAVQRLMAAGYGFAPSGDRSTAALVRALKLLGHGDGGTTFLEDTTYSRAAEGMAVYGSGLLELCPSVDQGQDRRRLTAPTIGDRIGVPRIEVSVTPGPAVNAACVQSEGSEALLANEVRILDAGAETVGVPLLEPRPDHTTAATCWALAGGPRYTALSTNVSCRILELWADMRGARYLGIDSLTSTRSFRRIVTES
jgi:L-arabinose isomerase